MDNLTCAAVMLHNHLTEHPDMDYGCETHGHANQLAATLERIAVFEHGVGSEKHVDAQNVLVAVSSANPAAAKDRLDRLFLFEFSEQGEQMTLVENQIDDRTLAERLTDMDPGAVIVFAEHDALPFTFIRGITPTGLRSEKDFLESIISNLKGGSMIYAFDRDEGGATYHFDQFYVGEPNVQRHNDVEKGNPQLHDQFSTAELAAMFDNPPRTGLEKREPGDHSESNVDRSPFAWGSDDGFDTRADALLHVSERINRPEQPHRNLIPGPEGSKYPAAPGAVLFTPKTSETPAEAVSKLIDEEEKRQAKIAERARYNQELSNFMDRLAGATGENRVLTFKRNAHENDRVMVAVDTETGGFGFNLLLDDVPRIESFAISQGYEVRVDIAVWRHLMAHRPEVMYEIVSAPMIVQEEDAFALPAPTVVHAIDYGENPCTSVLVPPAAADDMQTTVSVAVDMVREVLEVDLDTEARTLELYNKFRGKSWSEILSEADIPDKDSEGNFISAADRLRAYVAALIVCGEEAYGDGYAEGYEDGVFDEYERPKESS